MSVFNWNSTILSSRSTYTHNERAIIWWAVTSMQRDYIRHNTIDALFHLPFGILFTFHSQYTNLSSWYPLAVQWMQLIQLERWSYWRDSPPPRGWFHQYWSYRNL